MFKSIVTAIITVFCISCCSQKENNAEKETNSSILTKIEGNAFWSIEVATIEGHKYIVVSTGNGVAICPAKVDK